MILQGKYLLTCAYLLFIYARKAYEIYPKKIITKNLCTYHINTQTDTLLKFAPLLVIQLAPLP